MAKVIERNENLIKCIHGLFWKSCVICREKTLDEIELEKNFIKKSRESSTAYDYQESNYLKEAKKIETMILMI